MSLPGIARSTRVRCSILALLILAGCSDESSSPMEAPDPARRGLQPAYPGEMGVFIQINGGNLTDSTLAERLHVDVVIDSGRPT